LEEAVEAIGARTKKEAVEAGLRALIRMKQKEMLRKDLGTFDMDLSLSELEELRSAGRSLSGGFVCVDSGPCGEATMSFDSLFHLYGDFPSLSGRRTSGRRGSQSH